MTLKEVFKIANDQLRHEAYIEHARSERNRDNVFAQNAMERALDKLQGLEKLALRKNIFRETWKSWYKSKAEISLFLKTLNENMVNNP